MKRESFAHHRFCYSVAGHRAAKTGDSEIPVHTRGDGRGERGMTDRKRAKQKCQGMSDPGHWGASHPQF